jgi:soluble lytic murein transglycosylase-like protein
VSGGLGEAQFPTLARYGIGEVDLQEPCINIQVGAWILRQEVDRYGYSWEALGAYYAGPYTPTTQHWKLAHYRAYATKVLLAWRALKGVAADR